MSPIVLIVADIEEGIYAHKKEKEHAWKIFETGLVFEKLGSYHIHPIWDATQ